MPILLRWFLRLGPTNPIAVRLVQNGSRRARHFSIRIAYLGALIVVLLYALLFTGSSSSLTYQELASQGADSFNKIAYLQIALICVLAPVFMAGAIAQEADPRTWDILLTTPLGAAEIVLGNLFGRLFFILALLMSSLPLFAVTQYFGGVPGTSIFASYAIAGCAAILVGALAVSLSVSRLVGRRAVFTFYIAVVSYLAVTFAIDRVAGSGGVTWMTAINPFLALRALLDPAGYPSAPSGSETGLASFFLERPSMAWCVLSGTISVALVAVSAVTVRFGGIAGLGGLTGRTGSASIPWHRRLLGRGAAAEHRAPKTVWHNPISWREASSRNATVGRIFARWSFIAVGLILGVAIIALWHVGTFSTLIFQQVLLYTVMGEIAVVTLVAINMSATAVSREREDGTLDLILTTPITPAQYLSGKLQGIVAYVVPLLAVPVVTLLLAGVYVMLGGFHRAGGVDISAAIPASAYSATPPPPVSLPAVLPEAGIILAIVAVPFVALCVIVGMQISVKSKGTIAAVMLTVGALVATLGVVGLCAWKSGTSFAPIGPALATFSPASAAFSTIFPAEGLEATVLGSSGSPGSLSDARIALIVGAFAAAAAHLMLVYAMRSAMTRNFDMTVRKLAGIK